MRGLLYKRGGLVLQFLGNVVYTRVSFPNKKTEFASGVLNRSNSLFFDSPDVLSIDIYGFFYVRALSV